MDFSIRTVTEEDATEVARIYNHYIAETNITFETDAVSPGDMAERIEETLEAPLPWLIAETQSAMLGFAYASRWKGRCAYRYSVESTIYLDPDYTAQGIGRPLYSALIDAIRERSMHSVIGGIALPNAPSIKLHEELGFTKVGVFEEVGYKFDEWIDVGYWQLRL